VSRRGAGASPPPVPPHDLLLVGRCGIQAGDHGPTLLNGWDTLTFAALAAGVRAVVWGTASILPDQCVALHRLLIDDIDLPAARELWSRLWPLCKFLESHSYPAAVKTACALVGDTTGPARAPLLPLADDATTELQQLLNQACAGTVRPSRPRHGPASASGSPKLAKMPGSMKAVTSLILSPRRVSTSSTDAA
jgi:Dihydrodipicolinate synthetase family